MNKLRIALLLLGVLFVNTAVKAQEQTLKETNTAVKANDTITPTVAGYEKDGTYELGGIVVTGLRKYEEETVKVYSGLKIGQEIKLPGDKLTSAIKKLYETKQFSNVDVFVAKVDGIVVYLEFDVQE